MNLLLTLEGLVGGMVDHTSKAGPAGHLICNPAGDIHFSDYITNANYIGYYYYDSCATILSGNYFFILRLKQF